MVEISSKELVKGLFQSKDLPRTPFMPLVCSFAAQLEQAALQDMLSDAGALSSSLLNAQELFGYDAIVSVFDTTLEAEALGCGVEWGGEGTPPEVVSHPLQDGKTIDNLALADLDKRGRIPIVLESTKRLKIVRGKQVAIIGMVTGPLTLAEHLRGETFLSDLNKGPEEMAKLIGAAGSVALNLCRKYCEIGVDAIVVAEELLGQIAPDQYQTVAGPLKSIWNVLRFYNVNSILLSRGCRDEHIVPAFALQAEGVALSGSIDPGRIKEAALSRRSCYGAGIPTSAMLGDPSQVAAVVEDCLSVRGKGSFLTTEWDVQYAANVNTMHEIVNIIKGNQ